MFTFCGSANTSLNGFAVYTVSDNTGNLIYKNIDRVCRILTLEGFADNPDLNKNDELIVTVESFHEKETEARQVLHEWLRANEWPKFNKTKATRHKRMVRCNETGMIYKNQAECSRMENVAQSQLNKHLRGFAGFRTVKGKTYNFV